MIAVLGVTLPFFALVLIGWIAARRGFLPAGSVPALNTFVLYFALPCLLFRFVSDMPLRHLLDPSVVATYGLGAALMVLIALRIAKRAGRTRKDASFGALVTAFPNTGFMGLPLLIALYGPDAAGPVVTVIIVDMLFTSSACMALAYSEGGAGRSSLRASLDVMRGVASNPVPWGIAVGVLVSMMGLDMPAPLDAIVRMLAAAATPVALFSIGVALAARREVDDQSLLRSDALALSFVKLLVHPALVWIIGTQAIRLGMPLTSFKLSVIVLVAALPSASNVMMLAERNGADENRIAWIIFITTSVGIVSFSAIAWLLSSTLRL